MLGKGQAALEYLLTYGWALVVILIVVAVALGYFGFFSPSTCSLAATGITCVDFSVESSKVILVLQNSSAETITVEKIEVREKEGGYCSDSSSIMLKSNQKQVFTIPDCNNGTLWEKFDADMNITYNKGSGLSHLIKGSLSGRIAKLTTVSSSSTCQNAQNSGLCDGLDLLFGTGYEAACCSEHGLCC